ncbi:MAG: DegV family protein [Lachnospiraceae bacterium]
MKWNIVADSSCDLFDADLADAEIGFATIPFVIQIGEKEYLDDEELSVPEMLEEMERCKTAARTACPSPALWAEAFQKAQKNIGITISKHLSGSFGSANAARQMLLSENPTKEILLLDSCSTGPELILCIRMLRKWIKEGLDLPEIAKNARIFLDKTNVVFALSSFDNLVKNGRMNRLAGFAARTLGMWGIGIGSELGEIKMKGKTRGAAGALRLIIADMEERGYTGGRMAISHCENEEMARRLRKAIHDKWPEAKVSVHKTRGLDSFYAERGGLIVAY